MEINSSTYEQAATLLMERFPEMALLVNSWEVASLLDEKRVSFQPGKADVFYVYGLGVGQAFFSLRSWLEENSERELIFLEDQPSALAAFLHKSEAISLLSHPQVHVTLLPEEGSLDEALEALADRYPVHRVEIGALASYQTERFHDLQIQLFRKSALSYALYNDRLHGYQPFQNFLKNLPHLPGSFYANGLQNAFQGIPAIICGAGPSLQTSIDVLKKLENRALCIAGGSTLAALSSQGILPHFGMAIDPNLEEYRRLKNSFAFEVPLLYSTRVCPLIFQTCNGPFGYMRSGIGGVPEIWLEEELGLFDPLIGLNLSSESISVTTICVAWAQFLGCNPILLNGIDLAYTGNKHYAAGVTEEEPLIFQEIDEEKSAADRIIKRKDRTGKPIYTAVRWLMESACISQFATSHPEVQFINTTDGGIGFEEIPYMPLQEAADRYLQKQFDLRHQVQQKIAHCPMPSHTQALIEQKVKEMKESLERMIEHLRLLSGEKQKGSLALAEMELKEEMAYPYLFYDVEQVLQQALRRTYRSGMGEQKQASQEKWKRFLQLALQYHSMF